MEWYRASVRLVTDPKVVSAGQDGALLYIGALGYVGREETDGFIPAHALPGLTPLVRNPVKAARAVTDAGLWEPVKGGFLLPRWARYNPTKAEMERAQTERDERRRLERERKAAWRSQRKSHGTDTGTEGGTSQGTSAGTGRVHVRNGTERDVDLDLAPDSSAALGLQGGPGGEQPFDQDQDQEPVPLAAVLPEPSVVDLASRRPLELAPDIEARLNDDVKHLLRSVIRANGSFRSLPASQLERVLRDRGQGVLVTALQHLAESPPAGPVTHPRAYFDEVVAAIPEGRLDAPEEGP